MTESSLTCEQALTDAKPRIDSESFRLDAELLLAQVTGWSRTRFRAFPEVILEPEQLASYRQLVERRAAGEGDRVLARLEVVDGHVPVAALGVDDGAFGIDAHVPLTWADHGDRCGPTESMGVVLTNIGGNLATLLVNN